MRTLIGLATGRLQFSHLYHGSSHPALLPWCSLFRVFFEDGHSRAPEYSVQVNAELRQTGKITAPKAKITTR
ncbi:uncharacterized protein CIMG_11055 [Coccidioides immitis RS]|uniref:Uncharacterized protein n=4 Tax=Coccidioides immitis TaxID=5501 RepID=A0A0D8JWD2_COCIM|nr:uncharacterized protein CIMG_11055 [Coccidioides immitis RS]KJF61449.1 hypothetical protein CIMG_11055 [Coccidioides immitis RS]KMP07267.1 hypothetical protein CIRG_06948 [Coccidioides immitis RMSCC 2394]KMU80969.1 hypothetical protein CISG_08911 [Coccidioides immitis RMSCC 3703]KMU82342.1 hypothetical protein CIHG_00126 [Coccidioides immitis H538.4]